MYPILYFPLPAFHTDILQVIMNKLSPDDWKIVKAAVWNSGPREANDIMLRRLFHEIVYQFRDRRWPIRAGKTFVYRSGFKFLNWVDYLYPFKRIFWTWGCELFEQRLDVSVYLHWREKSLYQEKFLSWQDFIHLYPYY